MSQLAEAPRPLPEEAASDVSESQTAEPRGFRHSELGAEQEFQYQPMPMSAVIGAVLTLLSASALLTWVAIPVAVLAMLVCLMATVKIFRSRGELSGKWLATGGLLVSLGFAVAGVVLTAQRYERELPPGFQRVSFARDISAKGIGMQLVNDREVMAIPPDVAALNGKRVYLKGFIYPGKRPFDLTQFVLCKDNAQCCFGGQPALWDMVGVTLTGNKTTDYTTALTGVAGTFRLNPNYRGGSLEPVYLLEADHVAPALTSL